MDNMASSRVGMALARVLDSCWQKGAAKRAIPAGEFTEQSQNAYENKGLLPKTRVSENYLLTRSRDHPLTRLSVPLGRMAHFFERAVLQMPHCGARPGGIKLSIVRIEK